MDRDLPAAGRTGRDFQHRGLRIDQNAQARRLDRLGTHLTGAVHGADGKPELAVAAGANVKCFSAVGTLLYSRQCDPRSVET